jgi:hypothetical protein
LKVSIGSESSSSINELVFGEDDYPYKNKLLEALKTHKGSINLQTFMRKASISSIELIIDEINEGFGSLMID